MHKKAFRVIYGAHLKFNIPYKAYFLKKIVKTLIRLNRQYCLSA